VHLSAVNSILNEEEMNMFKKLFWPVILLIVSLTIVSLASGAEPSMPVFQWSKFWGGSADEYGVGIGISGGDIYVSGETRSFGAGDNDALLLKYDLTGNFAWSRTWGGSLGDTAGRLHISDDNIYVAAWTYSYANDPVGGLEPDTALLKYNPSGALLWYKTWNNYPGYSGWDVFYDVFAVGNDIYAVGSTQPSWNSNILLLQRYDADGNLIWSQFWGPIGVNIGTQGSRVVVSGDGIYVAGITEVVDGNQDALIMRYDPAGNLIWSRTWGGSGYEGASGVVVSGNDIYVVGTTSSFGAGKYDVFLLKYDSSGNLMWDKTWGGSEDDEAADMFISNNYLYVAAGTKSFGAGDRDAVILKTDLSGNPIWYETWGGTVDDFAYGLYVLGNDIYVTGYTRSFGSGGQDVFFLKYTEEGPIINNPPTVSADGPYSVDEGSSIFVTASGSDPDGDPITFAWDLDNNGTFETPGQIVTFSAAELDGPSSHTITAQVTDSGGLSATDQTTVDVLNVAPTVGGIIAPLEPIEVNTPINTSADFTDAGILDTHTAEWNWGDSSVSSGTVDETGGSGWVSGSHTYTTAGVYTVTLTVTDDDGGSGESIFQYVVIYNPDGGFVTGGGWIYSEPGAYQPNPSLEGKANFGFVSKYKKGAQVPTGETEFNFKVANLNFHSDSYEWLVVAGHKAQYKGVGTINGIGNYGFMLFAIDEELTPSTDVDLFRIKIWNKDNGDEVVYDNQMGAGDDAEPTTAIGGGNIKIHKGEGAAPAHPNLVLTVHDTIAPLNIPEEFQLLPNYPNPFNPDTWLPYELAADTSVSISIYNANGQLVRQLDLGYKQAGSYLDREKAAHWDGRDNLGQKAASGVYYYILQAGKYTATRKMVIMK